MSSRSFSLCGLNGHNSRTCVGNGMMIFGVHLTDGPMRECEYEHSDPAEVAAKGFDGYVSDDLVHSSNDAGEMERSKLVFFDRKKQFELEDLLRASVEMLGKGSFWTVVLNDGCVVAVKKLS